MSSPLRSHINVVRSREGRDTHKVTRHLLQSSALLICSLHLVHHLLACSVHFRAIFAEVRTANRLSFFVRKESITPLHKRQDSMHTDQPGGHTSKPGQNWIPCSSPLLAPPFSSPLQVIQQEILDGKTETVSYCYTHFHAQTGHLSSQSLYSEHVKVPPLLLPEALSSLK